MEAVGPSGLADVVDQMVKGPLVLVGHAFKNNPVQMPDMPGKDHNPFTDHRILLVGHGRTRDGSFRKGLLQLADFRLLELKDLIGHLFKSRYQ